MAPADRLKVLLFLALFFGALGFLFTLLSCGTEYWLLAVESCSRPAEGHAGGGGGGFGEAVESVRIFHEGLFWRCSYTAASTEYSLWDLWISRQPPPKLCQAALLFPFPVNDPVRSLVEPRGLQTEVYEHNSAIVYRTFWSFFLIAGLVAIVVGGCVVACASPLANHKLFKVGGALQLCGGLCLLAVVLMYLMWILVLDTLEQFAQQQRVSGCPSYHLSIHHGPSFLMAPVAVFFCLLAGLLFILGGRTAQGIQLEKRDMIPELPMSDV
ncbi:transmembrane protein 182-like [Acanthopagrus latus]|uniref:transmembrane protein 182-like n=1 Tax=Acanthopagrus latus TaxID=8177 RepID=UPI00187CFD2D|nr:transmembrane protein 182-like [Acanthopagrus latus]